MAAANNVIVTVNGIEVIFSSRIDKRYNDIYFQEHVKMQEDSLPFL